MIAIHRVNFSRNVRGIDFLRNGYRGIRLCNHLASRQVLKKHDVPLYCSACKCGESQSRPLLNNRINYVSYVDHVKYFSCSTKYINLNKKDNGTHSNIPPNKNGTSKIVHFFRRVRFVGEVFLNGCKNLSKDVKTALITRRKLGLFHQRDYSKLTRDEVHHMYQTKADVAKTFPVAFLFMIPVIGYFVPVLAYIFPRQMLSQQFWHPDQKKEIILEEYEQRSQYYLPLIKECAVTCKEIQSKELYRLCMHVINGNHPTNTELLQFKDVFAKYEDFSLQCVPRYHLVKLCKCWLIPTGWFLPRWYLMNALRRRISRIHQDDMLIQQEGVDKISPESIAKAVHVRGIDETALNLSLMKLLLTEWTHLSSQVTGYDVSFLAHCAAFKGANFEKIAVKNGTIMKPTE